MAISFIGSYNDGGAANPTSGTWSLSGTNAVAGDIAICIWYSRANTRTITPTGPSLITGQDVNTANGGHIWVGYKILTATDISNGYAGTWTSTTGSNQTTGCIVMVFRGIANLAPIRGYTTPASGGAGDPDPPNMASTTAGDALVAIFGEMDQNNGVTPPANFTLDTNAQWSTTLGTDGSSAGAYDLDGGTGSAVNPAVFATSTDAYWYATVISLKPVTTVAKTGTAKARIKKDGVAKTGTAKAKITNQAPSITSLNSPDDGANVVDTTPTVNFTGTDPEGNTIEYQVQIDTFNTFDSQY